MSFPFYLLPPDASVAASDQCLEHFVPFKGSLEHSLAVKVVLRVETENEITTKALAQKRAGELTQKITKEFDELGNSYKLFIDSLEVTSKRKGRKAQAEAADTVLAAVETHGNNLHKLPRQKMIGAIGALVDNCSDTIVREAIITAGAEFDFNEMVRELEETKNVLEESANLEADKSQILFPYEAGKKLNRALSDLYGLVDILAETKVEEYVKLKALMNETLDKFRPMLRKKSSESTEA